MFFLRTSSTYWVTKTVHSLWLWSILTKNQLIFPISFKLFQNNLRLYCRTDLFDLESFEPPLAPAHGQLISIIGFRPEPWRSRLLICNRFDLLWMLTINGCWDGCYALWGNETTSDLTWGKWWLLCHEALLLYFLSYGGRRVYGVRVMLVLYREIDGVRWDRTRLVPEVLP